MDNKAPSTAASPSAPVPAAVDTNAESIRASGSSPSVQLRPLSRRLQPPNLRSHRLHPWTPQLRHRPLSPPRRPLLHPHRRRSTTALSWALNIAQLASCAMSSIVLAGPRAEQEKLLQEHAALTVPAVPAPLAPTPTEIAGRAANDLV